MEKFMTYYKKIFVLLSATVKRRITAALAAILCIGYAATVHAHSVGQVQTTKYFTPETVQMLVDHANAGSPGLHLGDTVSYIIQFTPIANGATTGVAGYVTDYVPAGVEVIGASIVAKDGSGNFYDVAPNLPGGIDTGWGNRGQNTFLAPFNVAAYDATGRCAAAGYTNNCNARMTELYADTGIFFSTDSRTAQYPVMPTRIAQGTNGYNINPTGAAALNTLLNQLSDTTHNLWDANMSNAFGTTTAAVAALVAPKSAQASLTVAVNGRGPTPYNTGSAVAGPQTGYQLDDTGQVGPWQRIAYSGSRMGDNTLGPATVIGSCTTCVGGNYISVGWNLSPTNPLPAGTTAVRWAVGKLVVGTMSYVKISMRITSVPPSTGLINSSEVFGGDAGDGDDGKDNTWRYHAPSVADNNSNLYVLKTVKCVYDALGNCNASSGAYIPAGAKIRYRTVYLNTGNANQDNVILSDTLPCQTAANPVSNITVISGSISTTMNPAAPAAGNCATNPDTRSTFSFNNGVGMTLLPAAGGSIEYDVQTNAALASIVTNTAKLTSTQIPSGVTSIVNSYVQAAPSLTITKTTSTPSVAAGGMATYTITITNTGTAATATTLMVYDMLPTTGGVANALTRFSYLSTTSITGLTAVVPTVVVPPTLTPYNTGGVSTNQQQVLWNFGVQSLAAGASATITFNATVGANVTASATPYYNTAVVTYNTTSRTDTTNTAGVTVTSPLSVTKTIESYYDTATLTWVPYGNNIPINAKVRYKIDYSNTGGAAINNVALSDQLPCQTAANPVSNINIVNGPIGFPVPNPPVVAAGVCPGTRQTFSFTTAASLGAGQTGQIKLDVQTNAAAGNTVINTATLSGTAAAAVSSEAQASVTTAPLLGIIKTASVTGVAQGGMLSYTITVTNTGTANATNIVLYDWLPTGGAVLNPATRFSYSSTTSVTGLTSVVPTVVTPPTKSPYSTDANAANMQEIAWNFGAQTLAPGASFTVVFAASVGASVPVATYYNNSRVYYGTEQANSGAVGVAVGSNLSTSTKTWTDINGGDANPGDTIEYTIALRETAGIAVTGASVSDTLPAALTVPTVATCPVGATCGFVGQVLTVSNISVAANGTTNIVFRATIAAGTAAGTQINNCAAITNPGGTGAAPCAGTLTVAASTVPGYGNKPLYLYDATSVPAYKLSRAKPAAGAAVTINAGLSQTWTLSPALASSVTISNTISTTVPVQLYLTATAATNVTVGLYCGAALVTSLVQATPIIATPTLSAFNLPLAAPYTCAAASSWAVNVSSSAGTLTITPYVSATQISNLNLPSQNVISVMSVTPYSTVYPGATSPATYPAGTNVYIRAVVSDPFGSYDITSASITIKDSNNTTVVTSAAMTQVADDLAATKTFEYAYAIPALGPGGVWNVTVTAKEGTENIVSDSGLSSFYVTVMPSLTIVKSVQTFSDPVNGTTSPKAIPGAEMLYTIIVANSGAGSVDTGTTVITDPIPASMSMCVSTLCSNPPVSFSCSVTPACGLSYTYATNVTYSNQVGGGAPFNYTPAPDAAGYDANVTGVRINPSGILNGQSAGNPSFSLFLKMMIK